MLVRSAFVIASVLTLISPSFANSKTLSATQSDSRHNALSNDALEGQSMESAICTVETGQSTHLGGAKSKHAAATVTGCISPSDDYTDETTPDQTKLGQGRVAEDVASEHDSRSAMADSWSGVIIEDPLSEDTGKNFAQTSQLAMAQLRQATINAQNAAKKAGSNGQQGKMGNVATQDENRGSANTNLESSDSNQ